VERALEGPGPFTPATTDVEELAARRFTARDDTTRFRLVAAGKAAPRMAAAALRVLGRRIATALVVAPEGRPMPRDDVFGERVQWVEGGHPTPTRGSEEAGRRALAVARETAADGLLVLLSGGASALMAVPADGITLDDKRRVTECLLRGGADIRALNTVRKHLSAIKGGQLAAASRSVCRTFAISDVVGDDVSAIASGPTVADPTTFAEALDVLRRFGGAEPPPAAVVDRLTRGARGECPETPKPGDPRLAGSECRVIGGRRDAMRGAAAEANARGFEVITIDSPVVGDVRDAAAAYAREAGERMVRPAAPLCLVSSGETTVRVTGGGRGGRNQELALTLAGFVESLGPAAVLASVGTDGVDGPTDAAGAVVDATTLERARAAGLSPAASLSDNDSYALFEALGDLVRTGPTGTNVGDLQVFLLA
jgi:glycerate-2-kinase